jgi:hypothetical protein
MNNICDPILRLISFQREEREIFDKDCWYYDHFGGQKKEHKVQTISDAEIRLMMKPSATFVKDKSVISHWNYNDSINPE